MGYLICPKEFVKDIFTYSPIDTDHMVVDTLTRICCIEKVSLDAPSGRLMFSHYRHH